MGCNSEFFAVTTKEGFEKTKDILDEYSDVFVNIIEYKNDEYIFIEANTSYFADSLRGVWNRENIPYITKGTIDGCDGIYVYDADENYEFNSEKLPKLIETEKEKEKEELDPDFYEDEYDEDIVSITYKLPEECEIVGFISSSLNWKWIYYNK